MLITRTTRFHNFKNIFYCFRKLYSNPQKKKWRVVFFGTDKFALQCLEKLHLALLSGEIVSKLSIVVPAPKPNPCAVAKYASHHGLSLHEWPLPQDSPRKGDWDVGVVASFGHLIPNRVINVFPRGILNIHASLLPRWRGAAPINHALMNGDIETGITIMQIKPFHFDLGDIILQERVPIDSKITAVQLTQQLAQVGANLISKCLSDLEKHLDQSVPQSNEGVTLAPKISPSLSHVDWSQLTAIQVYNRWRATRHIFKLQTLFHGENTKLDGMEEPIEPSSFPSNPTYRAGTIVVNRKRNILLVQCREGWASFRHITLPRRPVMSALDFANGYLNKRQKNEHFFSPSVPSEMKTCCSRSR